MKNSGRRVVILSDVNSDIIEQAIFVLKRSASDGESKILQEAEKVVEKFMDKKRERIKEKKKLPVAVIISLGVVLFGIWALAFAAFN